MKYYQQMIFSLRQMREVPRFHLNSEWYWRICKMALLLNPVSSPITNNMGQTRYKMLIIKMLHFPYFHIRGLPDVSTAYPIPPPLNNWQNSLNKRCLIYYYYLLTSKPSTCTRIDRRRAVRNIYSDLKIRNIEVTQRHLPSSAGSYFVALPLLQAMLTNNPPASGFGIF